MNHQNSQGDDRIRRDNAPETRGDRGIVEDAKRADETGLVNSEADYEAMLASEWDQAALPTPPQIPGWHLAWLTTTSQYDTIQVRMRRGYLPVQPSELPGFDAGGQISAAHGNAIACNEMVLFKIKDEFFQAYMREFHHKRPAREEQAIYERTMGQASETDSSGRTLLREEDGNGFTQLGKNPATQGAPRFAP